MLSALLDFDIILVSGFLLLTLAVGMVYGRDVKNIKDYALGGRNFSTAALVSTIVATWASGSDFTITLSRTYSHGFYDMIGSVGGAVSFILMSYFLIPKMGEFIGATSIAEAMGKLYGKKVRVVTAVAGAIGASGLVAVQFRVFGNIFSYFLGIPDNFAILVAGVIATIYSAFGGIRAVTFTDILQFFAFSLAIPIVGILIWNNFYHSGLDLIDAVESSPKFNPKVIFDLENVEFLGALIMLTYYGIPTFSPPAFQRIAIGKNIEQVRKAFIIAGCILIGLKIAAVWIPFLLHSISPDIPNEKLLGYIIDNYSYTGLKGLIIVAIVAFSMSTADSRINSTTVLITHDILKVFNKTINEVLTARITALIIGIGAIMLSLIETDFLKIIVKAQGFYYPVVTPIFFLTVLGFRSSEKSVLAGMLAGFTFFKIWGYYSYEHTLVSHKMMGIIIAMLVNVATTMTCHYLFKQKGGWIKKTDFVNNETPAKLDKTNEGSKSFSSGDLLKRIVPKSEMIYCYVGLYFIIYTLTTVYSTKVGLLMENGKIILSFYQIMIVTGTIMAMYPIWPLSIKQSVKDKIIQIWWPMAIIYMLIFFSSFFVIFSEFNQLQFILFTINAILAALFLGWRFTLLALPVGFYAAVTCYRYFFGEFFFDLSLGSTQFMFFYGAVLVAIVLFIFLKPQQEHLAATEEKAEILDEKTSHLSARVERQEQEIKRLSRVSEVILNNVNHELRLPITGVINFSEMIDEQAQKLGDEYIQMLSRDLNKSSLRLSTMMLSMLDLATFNARKIELKKEKFDISQMVAERVALCKKIYLEDKPLKFKLDIQSDLPAIGDKNYLMQVIDNLITNSINYSDKGVIDIKLDSRVDGMVEFTISDEGKGISDAELEDVFKPFKVGSRTSSPAGGRGLGLSLCKAVVESHGGTIRAISRIKGAQISFLLPAKTK